MSDDIEGQRRHEAAIAQLSERARELMEGVNQLTGETGDAMVGLAKRARSNRRLILALGASLLLDVVLTVVLGLTVHRVDSNSEKVDRLSSELRVQLCAQLQIFANSDNPTNRAAAAARGDDLAQRDAAYRVIHNSYDTLHCSAVIAP